MSQLGTYKSRHSGAGNPTVKIPPGRQEVIITSPHWSLIPQERLAVRDFHHGPVPKPDPTLLPGASRQAAKPGHFIALGCLLTSPGTASSAVSPVFSAPSLQCQSLCRPTQHSALLHTFPHALFFSLSTECSFILFHLLNLNLTQKYFEKLPALLPTQRQESHPLPHSHTFPQPGKTPNPNSVAFLIDLSGSSMG